MPTFIALIILCVLCALYRSGGTGVGNNAHALTIKPCKGEASPYRVFSTFITLIILYVLCALYRSGGTGVGNI
jgi:hypothetical protein